MASVPQPAGNVCSDCVPAGAEHSGQTAGSLICGAYSQTLPAAKSTVFWRSSTLPEPASTTYS